MPNAYAALLLSPGSSHSLPPQWAQRRWSRKGSLACGLHLIKPPEYVAVVVLRHVWLLWPHGLQHTRLACPSQSPRICLNLCPLSQWCHSAISSSVVPFSFCLPSFPASGSFLMSQFFASGGQSIGVSISASVLPMSIQGWSPLGLTSLISLQSKGLSKSSPTPQLENISSNLILTWIHDQSQSSLCQVVLKASPSDVMRKVPLLLGLSVRIEAQEIKGTAKVSSLTIHSLPDFASPGSTWKAVRREERGSVTFSFPQPLFLWITGYFHGYLASSLEGGASGYSERGARWGFQRGEAPQECTLNGPQELLASWLCPSLCIALLTAPNRGTASFPHPALRLAC